jgi:hypothetical protein
MSEPNYRKHTHEEERECDWCGKPVYVLYQVPDLAPTGESDFICLECATCDEWPDEDFDDYPAFDANQLFH